MARLKALPSLEIIRGFKGIIDFYLWKGLPCARAWPRYRPAQRSAAAIAAAILFGQIVKAYSLLASAVLAAYHDDAKEQPRTARDLMISGVLGHLHEATMSDFLTLLTECRDSLVSLEALLNALDSVGTDELDVNVEDSVLPDGAATAAHQVTQNAALATIETLAEALESVDTDAFQVRGRDQLFSYATSVASRQSAVISGANGWVNSEIVPANTVWLITRIVSNDTTSATTKHNFQRYRAAVYHQFAEKSAAFAAGDYSYVKCRLFMNTGARVRVTFTGGQIGDTCIIRLHGYQMTREA